MSSVYIIYGIYVYFDTFGLCMSMMITAGHDMIQ